uniref:Vomeronasal type-1 receptor n=1 Tax=Xenopus tropicalis TaxID=8364 RepID=A0A6I8PSH0_XENTR
VSNILFTTPSDVAPSGLKVIAHLKKIYISGLKACFGSTETPITVLDLFSYLCGLPTLFTSKRGKHSTMQDLLKGLIFLLQMKFGVIANGIILVDYLGNIFSGIKKIDFIVCHLTLVNLVSLLSRGIPYSMMRLGVPDVLTDVGCKAVIYTYRVTRALSITSTCSLSVFQLATIAPTVSPWAIFKSLVTKYILYSFVGFWIFHMCANSTIPLTVGAPVNNTIPQRAVHLGFCYAIFLDYIPEIVSTMFTTGIDYLNVTIMTLCSVTMLVLLKRHSQQVRYLQSTTQSVEVKASKIIISLVSLYVLFHGIDSLLLLYSISRKELSSILAEVRVFLSSSFAAISPLILINFSKRMLGRNTGQKISLQ